MEGETLGPELEAQSGKTDEKMEGSISPPWQEGTSDQVAVGASLGIADVHCRVFISTTACQMPVAKPLLPMVTTKNTSRHHHAAEGRGRMAIWGEECQVLGLLLCPIVDNEMSGRETCE